MNSDNESKSSDNEAPLTKQKTTKIKEKKPRSEKQIKQFKKEQQNRFQNIENINLNDLSTVIASFSVSQKESLTILDILLGGGWFVINDNQTITWVSLDDSQTPNWTQINNSQ